MASHFNWLIFDIIIQLLCCYLFFFCKQLWHYEKLQWRCFTWMTQCCANLPKQSKMVSGMNLLFYFTIFLFLVACLQHNKLIIFRILNLFQACIVMSLCDSNTYTELLTATQKYQCFVYYGNALYHLCEYTKAEVSIKKLGNCLIM